MFLSDISIRRPVFATMMMVTLVVLGIVAYKRLSLDEYPDVTYPVIIVQTSYPGTSPEVMERQISRPSGGVATSGTATAALLSGSDEPG